MTPAHGVAPGQVAFGHDTFGDPTVDRAGSVKIDQREGLCDEGFVLMRP